MLMVFEVVGFQYLTGGDWRPGNQGAHDLHDDPVVTLTTKSVGSMVG